mmetsp:Transcript_9737/g.40911  ORF Transcript_9737/g.40911 Transcript_9737/m.40911 type:complete len:200 (+) Transcript_9737:677-1276(+)
MTSRRKRGGVVWTGYSRGARGGVESRVRLTRAFGVRGARGVHEADERPVREQDGEEPQRRGWHAEDQKHGSFRKQDAAVAHHRRRIRAVIALPRVPVGRPGARLRLRVRAAAEQERAQGAQHEQGRPARGHQGKARALRVGSASVEKRQDPVAQPSTMVGRTHRSPHLRGARGRGDRAQSCPPRRATSAVRRRVSRVPK